MKRNLEETQSEYHFKKLKEDLQHKQQDVKFFWWDLVEDRATYPGTLFLFGKSYNEVENKFASCCVTVTNIKKVIYLLPRKMFLGTDTPVTMKDVYNELYELLSHMKQVKKFYTRIVRKKYVFDKSVPKEADYLEVSFVGTLFFDNPPTFNTIQRIFGLKNSLMEIFLLDRALKGPCWLSIKNPQQVLVLKTYCEQEVRCSSPEDLTVLLPPIPPIPALTVLSLDIKTVPVSQSLIEQRPEDSAEIAMIAWSRNTYDIAKNKLVEVNPKSHCVFTKINDDWPAGFYEQFVKSASVRNAQKLDSEKALLNYVVPRFADCDADLIVGDNMKRGISVLCDRLYKYRVQNIFRLSRMRTMQRNKLPHKRRTLFAGRILCDLKTSTKGMVKVNAHDFPALCLEFLEIEKENLVLVECYNSAEKLCNFIVDTLQNAELMLRVLERMNLIPLSIEITNVVGNTLARTLTANMSERNEYLFLHAFHDRNHIPPERFNSVATAKQPSTKGRYAGGLVLVPKTGYYQHPVLLMDFKSMYPSIIQEYNICFSTMGKRRKAQGIVPVVAKQLIEDRGRVQESMASLDRDSDEFKRNNVRQLAMKLIANSCYGYIGSTFSRFSCLKLAAMITRKGREILTNAKKTVEGLGYEVIYGDTDSLMIAVKDGEYSEVLKLSERIRETINANYKIVRLDLDAVYENVLILKKKKYAAVRLNINEKGEVEKKLDIKGLEFLRRDYCELSKEVSTYVLKQILFNKYNCVGHIQYYLQTVAIDVNRKIVPLEQLVMSKTFMKSISDYNKNMLKQFAHVQIALRNNANKSKTPIDKYDCVKYVICDDDDPSKSSAERAYTIEEFNKHFLSIDSKYYLVNQIYKVLSRICLPIRFMTDEILLNALNLTLKDIHRTVSEKINKRKETVFKNVKPFSYKCKFCSMENFIHGIVDNNELQLIRCVWCRVEANEFKAHLYNQLHLQIRGFIKLYNKSRSDCDNVRCPGSKIVTNLKVTGAKPKCPKCKTHGLKRFYTEADLYYQLVYLRKMFTVVGYEKFLPDDEAETILFKLKSIVDQYLTANAFSTIDLSKLFSNSIPKTHFNLIVSNY